MTTCRRGICGEDTDGKPFCSERCERLYSPASQPTSAADAEARAHERQERRARRKQGKVLKR